MKARQGRFQGQSLVEYGLIGGLIAVVAISALALVGDNLSGMLSALVSDMSSQPAQQESSAPSEAGGTGTTPPPSDGVMASGSSIKLSDGTVLDIGAYPSDLKTAINTAGANGTTEMLLASLDKIIEQAVAKGEMTEAQGNQLRALSNKGHEIAAIQGFLENMAETNPASLAKPFTYQGQYYEDAIDLAIKIGFDTGAKIDQPISKEFRDLYQQAMKTGALSDPTLSAAVGTLVDQIANISNGVEGATVMFTKQQLGEANGLNTGETFNYKVITGLTERDEYLGLSTQQGLAALGPSYISHQSSGGICNIGGGSDSGTQCGT